MTKQYFGNNHAHRKLGFEGGKKIKNALCRELPKTRLTEKQWLHKYAFISMSVLFLIQNIFIYMLVSSSGFVFRLDFGFFIGMWLGNVGGMLYSYMIWRGA